MDGKRFPDARLKSNTRAFVYARRSGVGESARSTWETDRISPGHKSGVEMAAREAAELAANYGRPDTGHANLERGLSQVVARGELRETPTHTLRDVAPTVFPHCEGLSRHRPATWFMPCGVRASALRRWNSQTAICRRPWCPDGPPPQRGPTRLDTAQRRVLPTRIERPDPLPRVRPTRVQPAPRCLPRGVPPQPHWARRAWREISSQGSR